MLTCKEKNNVYQLLDKIVCIKNREYCIHKNTRGLCLTPPYVIDYHHNIHLRKRENKARNIYLRISISKPQENSVKMNSADATCTHCTAFQKR